MRKKSILIKSLCTFVITAIITSTSYGLAPPSSLQDPLERRRIFAELHRRGRLLRIADSPDEIALLEANNTSCLLLSSGKYLISEEVARNALELCKCIIHEDIEAVMQILAEGILSSQDRYKYQAIKELVLKHFPPSEDSILPINLYVNHTVARIFQWKLLLDKELMREEEIPPTERHFVAAVRELGILNKRSTHFTAEFWDSRIRGEKIRIARNKGMRFYQVAGENSETNEGAQGREKAKRDAVLWLKSCLEIKEPKRMLERFYGGKAVRLAEMREMGLRVPDGFVIASDATDEEIDKSIDTIITSLEQRERQKFGDENNPLKLAVRSSPAQSMPGLLLTRTNVTTKKELTEAIKEVRTSWRDSSVQAFRRANNITDDVGTAVVIQPMIHGDKNDNSASGVMFTRDINTGENRITGRFALCAKGEEIVSRTGIKTLQIKKDLETKFPGAYKELEQAKDLLERKFGKIQEFEFVIEDGKLWIVQSKDAEVTPQAQAKVAVDMVREGVTDQFRMLTGIIEAQDNQRKKKLYCIRDDVEVTKIDEGIPSSPGVAYGSVVFSLEKAEEFKKQSKTPILIAFERPDEIEQAILSGAIGGIITQYGHEALHESVLARSQGIPLVDNVKNMVPGEKSVMINEHRLSEGSKILVDGSEGSIYVTKAHNPLVEDRTVSVVNTDFDYTLEGKKIRYKYKNYSYEALIEEHGTLVVSTKDSRIVTLNSILDNLKAHVIHTLIFEKGKKLGKDERTVIRDTKDAKDLQSEKSSGKKNYQVVNENNVEQTVMTFLNKYSPLNKSSDEAKAIINNIAEMGQIAIPALIKALGDEYYMIRYGAAKALGKMGNLAKDAVIPLAETLEDKNGSFTATGPAAEALGKIGPPAISTLPALVEASGQASAIAIGKICSDNPKAFIDILRGLQKEEKEERAINLIGQANAIIISELILTLNDNDTKFCKIIRNGLSETNDEERVKAIKMLGKQAKPKVLKALKIYQSSIPSHLTVPRYTELGGERPSGHRVYCTARDNLTGEMFEYMDYPVCSVNFSETIGEKKNPKYQLLAQTIQEMENRLPEEDKPDTRGHPRYAFENMPEEIFTLKQYCQNTHVPLSTARRDFNILEALGLVTIHRGSGGKPNEIECVIPWVSTDSTIRKDILQILQSYHNKNDLRTTAQKIFNLTRAGEERIGRSLWNIPKKDEWENEAIEHFLSDAIPSSPLPVEENVHTKYRIYEIAILTQEKKLAVEINGAEAELRAWWKFKDPKKTRAAATRLLRLRKELARVLKARKKFIKLGWPSRHAHTNEDGDDGKYSSKDLVDLALTQGLTVLYVTPHNSIEGSVRAMEYAEGLDYIIELRPGIEIEAPFADENNKNPFGYLHWRITGPNDAAVMGEMRAVTEEIDKLMEQALQRRFEKIKELATMPSQEAFDEAIGEISDGDLKQKIGDKWQEKGIINNANNVAEIKEKLFELYQAVGNYITSDGELPERWLNRKNLLGKWTENVFGNRKQDKASEKRGGLRKVIELLYKDEDIERGTEEEAEVRIVRAEKVVEWFANLNTYVIAAHPGLEIFIDNKEQKAQETMRGKFIKRVISMVNSDHLHGMGTQYQKYTREVQGKIEGVKEIIEGALKKGKIFYPDGANSDFHGEAKDDIKLGQEHKDKKSGETYSAFEEEPDREEYFRDGRFLAGPYITQARAFIDQEKYLEAMDILNTSLKTDWANREAEELLIEVYRRIGKLAPPAYAFEHIPEGKFTLRDYCLKTGIPRSTARDAFNVLEELGLVRASGGKPNKIECVIPQSARPSIETILKTYRNKNDISRIRDEVFYEEIKIIINPSQALTKEHIKELDRAMRVVAERARNFVTGREGATDYSLWNIQEEHVALYSLKQFYLTYEILDRVFEKIENSHYSRTRKNKLIEIVQYFFYAALPEFIDGRKGNPIHHNVQALENMLTIVLAEKPDDYEFLKRSVVLALLHDIGNSRASGEKVISSDLKKLKEKIKDANTPEIKRELERGLREKVADALDYRRSHMVEGAKLVPKLISAYEENHAGKWLFAKADVKDICATIAIHDNPSSAKYKKDILEKLDKKLLFSDNKELAKYLREADRAWMLSPEGFEKDLIDAKKKEFKEGKPAKNPKEQLEHNIGAQHSEYAVYREVIKEKAKLDAYKFKKETLYRTEAGYSLYQEFVRRTRRIIVSHATRKESSRKSKNLQRGRIDELSKTHPALDKAANEGRMFAALLDQVDKFEGMPVEELADIFTGNLKEARGPPDVQDSIKQLLLERLKDPTFKENLIKGFQLMGDAIEGQPLPQDPNKPVRLCVVIEDENLSTIVFKDAYNNLIAHSGEGIKTNTPYTSIYAGYNSLKTALATNEEDAFKEIITHEARDIIRGYHVNEETERMSKLYDDTLDLYDTKSTTVLFLDLLHTPLNEGKIYEIKYDTSRLSPSQIGIIETYISLLQKRALNPNNIKSRPFSSKRGSKESLIAVYCTGKDFEGKGCVDVDIPDGNIADYLLRITGMLNIALAASNIPDRNVTDEEIKTEYGPLIGFIQNQYKVILGADFEAPYSAEELLEKIKNLVLTLPSMHRMDPDKITEYNRLCRKTLLSV